jgi:hypothetical protein
MMVQALLTVIAVGTSWMIWDAWCALAAAAAGLISAADLALISLITGRLAAGRTRGRIFYSVVLSLKFPLLAAAVYLLVVVLSLDTMGLIIGFSTLVMAVLYASVSYQKRLAGGEGT